MSDGPRAAMQVCARCGGAGGDPWDGPCTDCRGEGALLVTAEVLHPDGECSRCRHRPHTGVCGYLPDDEVEPYRCQCTLSTRTAASGGTTDGEPAVPVPRFRDQLAEALHEWMGGDRDYYDAPVAALMPTIAAEVEARVQAATNQRAVEAATDALMWAAWTVEHSPGIKHQARAVTAIRDRAAALDAS